jgi:hypothetical protein
VPPNRPHLPSPFSLGLRRPVLIALSPQTMHSNTMPAIGSDTSSTNFSTSCSCVILSCCGEIHPNNGGSATHYLIETESHYRVFHVTSYGQFIGPNYAVWTGTKNASHNCRRVGCEQKKELTRLHYMSCNTSFPILNHNVIKILRFVVVGNKCISRVSYARVTILAKLLLLLTFAYVIELRDVSTIFFPNNTILN